MGKKRYIWIIMLLGVTLLPIHISPAQNNQEIRVKANYIVRFSRNISWPSAVRGTPGTPFIIGVIGSKSVADQMQSILSTQMVKGQPFEVKRFSKLSEIERVPILFISETSKLFVSGIFKQVSGMPTLVISEKQGHINQEGGGSDIVFVKSANDWLYEIFPEQIKSKGLYVQPSLIEAAYRTIKPQTEEPVKTITDLKTIKVVEFIEDPKAKELAKEIYILSEQNKQKAEELGISLEKRDSLMASLDKLALLQERDSLEAQNQKNIADLANADRARALQQKKTVEANQRTQLSILIAVIVFLSTIALVFYIFSQRRKKIIEEVERARAELSEKVVEINSQNDLLGEQNELLEEQNRKITDSIRYALTIQEAMLPTNESLNHLFNEHFIIYIPKDIVSGDFYWIAQPENQDMTLVAVVDCTGHGVPGAFMSTIGTDLLNEIVNEKHLLRPSRILEMLHEGIYDRLRQGVTNNRDGMDVCLCMLQPTSNGQILVTFAGAKRPLYFTQDGELKRISGDSKYIGGIRRQKQDFHNRELLLNKGDMLYLTTDGYIDTPNADRRKFGSKNFQHLLDSIMNEPIDRQEEVLLESLRTHQQGVKTRDDITILGIKL